MHGVTDPAIEESVCAYVKLFRATRAVQARIEPFLAQRGLTPTQLGVLEALLHLGPMTQRELGRKVLTSAGNMTDVLDKLARRDLIERCRGEGDRRSVRVVLTNAGRTMIEQLFPLHARDIHAAMSGLSLAETRRLGALLRKLGCAAQDGVPATLDRAEVPTHFAA